MAIATWNGVTLAESDDVTMIEGTAYFPPDTVDQSRLEPSPLHTRCYWKGRASYFDVVVGNRRLAHAAFTYPKPWPLARRITGYVAFWQGVTVRR